MLALLEMVDNPRQDVPLISVLRSPLFGFTADRLAEVRAAGPDRGLLRRGGGRWGRGLQRLPGKPLRSCGRRAGT